MSEETTTNEHDASVAFWKKDSHSTIGDCLRRLITFLFIVYIVECNGCGLANQWIKANADVPCQQCDHTTHPPVVTLGEGEE